VAIAPLQQLVFDIFNILKNQQKLFWIRSNLVHPTGTGLKSVGSAEYGGKDWQVGDDDGKAEDEKREDGKAG